MASPFLKGRKKERPELFGKWESIIENELKTTSKEKRARIFASSAGLCSRQTAGMFFLPEDLKNHRKASTQFYFKVGSLFEDIVGEALNKSGILLDRETRIEAYHKKLPISGRIDFVAKDPEDGGVVLLELKTCGKLPVKPKPAHLAQLLTYLALTGMPRGIIWYFSRTVAGWGGSLIQKVFEVEPTEDDIRDVLFKMTFGALSAKKKFLPPLPDDMKRYKCGFCPLIPYCWEGKDELIVGAMDFDAMNFSATTEHTNKVVEDVMMERPYLKEQFEKLMLG